VRLPAPTNAAFSTRVGRVCSIDIANSLKPTTARAGPGAGYQPRVVPQHTLGHVPNHHPPAVAPGRPLAPVVPRGCPIPKSGPVRSFPLALMQEPPCEPRRPQRTRGISLLDLGVPNTTPPARTYIHGISCGKGCVLRRHCEDSLLYVRLLSALCGQPYAVAAPLVPPSDTSRITQQAAPPPSPDCSPGPCTRRAGAAARGCRGTTSAPPRHSPMPYIFVPPNPCGNDPLATHDGCTQTGLLIPASARKGAGSAQHWILPM
jgi:hypothetical protein